MDKTVILQKMSKNITLADITEALKPIHLALKQMKEEKTGNDTMIHEIHNMAVENSTKLDLFNGHFSSILSSLSAQPAPKKLVGRKGSAKKAPAKKAVKKGKKTADDDENEEKDGEKDDENEEKDDENDNDDENGEENDKKKKTVKKAPVKKTKKEPVKKTVKTTKKKETAKKQSKLNKMQYFKKAYEEDSTTFDKFLTNKVKKSIDTDNKEKFDTLEGANLQKAKVNAYYTYFRDNHSDELDNMRDAYIADNADGDAEEEPKDTSDHDDADE